MAGEGRPSRGSRRHRTPAAPGRTIRASAARVVPLVDLPWQESLQRRLRSLVAQALRIRVTDNVHTMLSFSRRDGVLEVRLHHMFLSAPDPVVHALAHYIRGTDPEASAVLDRFIQRNRQRIRRVPPHVRQRRVRIRERGRHHDLREILRELAERHFGGPIDCAITWGCAPRAHLPRKSIKLGSYSADARLIRIHPALDQPDVPRFFVAWIVFHEMLHHKHGVSRRGGRRCVHTPGFYEDERRFPDYERARAWERENLDRLLAWSPAAQVPAAQSEESG